MQRGAQPPAVPVREHAALTMQHAISKACSRSGAAWDLLLFQQRLLPNQMPQNGAPGCKWWLSVARRCATS